MKTRKSTFVFLWFAALLVPTDSFSLDLFDHKDDIWENGRNVFVRLAAQDDARFGQNDHPVKLDAEAVAKALGTLVFAANGSDGSGHGNEPAFTRSQTKLLGQHLVAGLGQARPDQDIVFALDKVARSRFGLGATRLFVAGRVFYKGEQLNIIFGEHDRLGDRGFEVAYDPTHLGIVTMNFNHGRRSKPSKPFRNVIEESPGATVSRIDGTQRNDWLKLDLPRAEWRGRTEPPPSPAPSPAPAVRSTPRTPQPPAVGHKTVEERLTILKRLKTEDLITDEEYLNKRQEILDDL